ncbi:MAG: thioredoxin domain-containing protein [Deltaproteobacteria bacterium]|nr:thioredoxin domain-containing protein [Deltaproteobacteria bacterium]
METSLRKGAIVGLILVGLVGVVISGVTTAHHYKIAGNGFEEKSFCSLSEFVDCDVAIASPYSKFLGIPVAELALLFFLFVSGASVYAWFSEKRGGATLSFLLAASLVALGYSGYMAWVSFAKLHVLCLLCSGLYLTIFVFIILLLVALRLSPFKIPSFLIHYVGRSFAKGEENSHLAGHLVATGIFFALGLLFFFGFNPQAHSRSKPFNKEAFVRFYNSAPQQEILIPEGRPSWGDPNAKVTLVEFSDFECPFCRRAAFSIKPFLGEYRKSVRLVMMHYPLDMSCNPNVQHPMHESSCLAAKAASCAHQKGKFWDYSELVFKNQKRLSRNTLVALAKQVGLEEESFSRCLASDEANQVIQEDIALGTKLMVHGTPSLFVNGRLLPDWTNPDKLQAVVEAELKNQK